MKTQKNRPDISAYKPKHRSTSFVNTIWLFDNVYVNAHKQIQLISTDSIYNIITI